MNPPLQAKLFLQMIVVTPTCRKLMEILNNVSLKNFLAALALLLCSSASCHAPVFPALLWRVATDPLLTVFRCNRFETCCAFDHIKPMVDAFFLETVSDFPAT